MNTPLWNEILQTAILGTERKPLMLPGPAANDAAGTLLAGLATQDPAAQLLGAAAIVSLTSRAAMAGLPPVPPPATSPEETLPAAPPMAARLLEKLLDTRPALVPEFCEVCAAANFRLPDSLLPRLLAFAQTRQAARQSISPVLGQRGAWLARQNPDWAFAAPAVLTAAVTASQDDAVWQTGTREQRLRFLGELRSRDAAAARRLVETAWSQEDPDMRAEILKNLAEGLSLADEPLLETGLDDRRKEVRTAAQALLIRLPQSALANRLLARALACCKFTETKPGLMARLTGSGPLLTLEVELPAACDKAMERDGIAAKVPAHLKIGERNWWFRQILAAVPPSSFVAATGFPAGSIDKAVQTSDFAQEIRDSWHEATKRCHDPDWAYHLYVQNTLQYRDLLPVLRPEQREEILLDIIAKSPTTEISAICEQLLAFENGIPPRIARAAANYLREAVLQAPANISPWYLPWEELAYRFPASLAGEILARWPTPNEIQDTWCKHTGKFQEALACRYEIRQTLTPPKSALHPQQEPSP